MKPNKKLLTSLLLLFFLSGGYIECHAQFFRKKKTQAQVQKKDTASSKKEYDKFFSEKHIETNGLIKMHKMKGKLYFELPLKLLDKDMMLGSTVSEISNNANAIIGSKPTEPLHIQFSKIGNIVNLNLMQNNVIATDKDSLIDKAVKISNIGAVIGSFKISVYSPDSAAVVFDVTDFFAAENKFLTPFDKYSQNMVLGARRTESFKKDRSYIDDIKSFKDNVVIKSYMSYTYSISGGKGVAVKDEPFTAVMTRSIILLDTEPYRPRITDSRIAIFPTRKVNYSGQEQRAKTMYYANRWRLEPVDYEAYNRGEKVEVKKPIVFYVDDNFPQNWKKHIKAGVNQWRELFEEIGLKNAIRAEDYPKDDPEFDPDNIKYSCIRYAPISVANAMGPSWTDPRSGEILNASVYVYHNVVQLLNNWIFIQTSPVDKRTRKVQVPEDILGDGLRYVISHEIGHCLGFMHNMSASSKIPTDSLRSPSFTQKYGTTTSIMDYARYNYVAQPGDMEKGVKLTPPRFGEYDRFLIRWNYTPISGTKTPEEDYKITSRWLQEASRDSVLLYGKQQFIEIIDPRSQNEDLGDDNVKASEYGIRNLKYLLENYQSWIDNEDPDYSYRAKIYDGIILQYYMYLNHVYANIGGVYMNERHEGDSVYAYRSVPKERQKEAMVFLLNQISDLDWIDNKDLMKNITLMGSPASALQNLILKSIIAAPAKVEYSASISNAPYTVEECFDDIYQFIWKPTIQQQALTRNEMKMQTIFLNNLGAAAGFKLGKGTNKLLTGGGVDQDITSITNKMHTMNCACGSHGLPDDISIEKKTYSGYDDPGFYYFTSKGNDSLYYGYLLKIRDLLKSRSNSVDKSTRLHYQLMLLDIEKALN